MAKIGRPKSENVKKKVLSIRVEDFMHKCICDYARKHKMTVTEVVLQGLEKVLNKMTVTEVVLQGLEKVLNRPK